MSKEFDKDVDGRPISVGDLVMLFWEDDYETPEFYWVEFGKFQVMDIQGNQQWQHGYALYHIKSKSYESIPYDDKGQPQLKKAIGLEKLLFRLPSEFSELEFEAIFGEDYGKFWTQYQESESSTLFYRSLVGESKQKMNAYIHEEHRLDKVGDDKWQRFQEAVTFLARDYEDLIGKQDVDATLIRFGSMYLVEDKNWHSELEKKLWVLMEKYRDESLGFDDETMVAIILMRAEFRMCVNKPLKNKNLMVKIRSRIRGIISAENRC